MVSLQGDELKGAPGELSNYEESKGGEREKLNDERGDRDGGEISEHGSVDQTKVVAEREMNSDVHEQHLNGKEAIGENSKDAFPMMLVLVKPESLYKKVLLIVGQL